MVVCLAVAIAISGPLAAFSSDTTWSPKAKDLKMRVGESTSIDVKVKLGSKPIPKVDVLFVFDVTGSMGGELESAKIRGKALMEYVASDVVPNARFGVASFCDYPGAFAYGDYASDYGEGADYPWALDSPITKDIGDAQAAIKSLSIRSGSDTPEDYTRALYECAEDAAVGWRSDTKKIVVVFGDAPPHDLTFDGSNTGGDPGRDGVAETDDDLEYTDVVSLLKKRGIAVLSVNCGSSAEAQTAFEYVAEETGGAYGELSDDVKLKSLTQKMIQAETTKIDKLSATADGPSSAWVKLEPASRASVKAGAEQTFKVKVSVPTEGEGVGGTRVGNFVVHVVADGVEVATVPVNILLKGPKKPTNYRPSKNGYSFVNEGSAATWEEFAAYYGKDVVQTAEGDHYWAADKDFEHNWKPVSTGSCFGMAMSSIAVQQGLQSFSPMPSGGTLVDAPKPESEGGVFKHNEKSALLESYQPRQYDPRFDYLLTAWGGTSPNEVLAGTKSAPGLKDYIDEGQPVAIAILHGKTGHALTAYKYMAVGADETRVFVYDCNHEKDNGRYVLFNRARDSWEYEPLDWSWATGDLYLDRAWLTGGWKKMSKEAKAEADGSCLIGFAPVNTVLTPGTPPWNDAKLPMTNWPVSASFADMMSVSVSGVATAAITSSERITWVGPLGYNPETSNTVSPQQNYVGRRDAEVSVSLEPSAGLVTAVSLVSQGSYVGLEEITGGGITSSLAASGAVSLQAAGAPADYNYSVSREASGSSHAIEIAGSSVEVAGADEFTPGDDLSTLDFVNDGASSTYGVSVHSIGSATTVYGAKKLHIGSGDRHTVGVKTWNLDASAPVVLVDRGNDGSIDDTITLAPMNSGSGGMGGGNPGGDDSAMWFALAGVALVGVAGTAIYSSRKVTSPTIVPVGPMPVGDAGQVVARLVESSGGSFVLTPGENRIGRDQGADIVLNDAVVSRTHATIHLAPGENLIRDEESSGGTWLNGSRVTEARLSDGDVLRFGDTELTLQLPAPSHAAPPDSPLPVSSAIKASTGNGVGGGTGGRVRVLLNGSILAVLPLSPSACFTIGRSGSNSVIVADPKVSGTHATLIVHSNGDLGIADSGSTNGTFVNGTPISSERGPLSADDEVTLGSSNCRLGFEFLGREH